LAHPIAPIVVKLSCKQGFGIAAGIPPRLRLHKHMGVYNGRPFPALFNPPPPLTASPFPRNKSISLDFVGQKLQELLNKPARARQPGSADQTQARHRTELRGPDPDVLHGFAIHRKRSSRSRRSASRSRFPDGRDLVAQHLGIGQFTTWFGLGSFSRTSTASF
jgi:hypothetical protein